MILRPRRAAEDRALAEAHEYLPQLGLEDDREGDDEAGREDVEDPGDRRELEEVGRARRRPRG